MERPGLLALLHLADYEQSLCDISALSLSGFVSPLPPSTRSKNMHTVLPLATACVKTAATLGRKFSHLFNLCPGRKTGHVEF